MSDRAVIRQATAYLLIGHAAIDLLLGKLDIATALAGSSSKESGFHCTFNGTRSALHSKHLIETFWVHRKQAFFDDVCPIDRRE